MNEMRKWMSVLETISPTDVETVIVSPARNIDNWMSYRSVASSMMTIVHLSQKVRELISLYARHTTANRLPAVGSEFILDYLLKFEDSIMDSALTINNLPQLNHPVPLKEHEVISLIHEKLALVGKYIEDFLKKNMETFQSSPLVDTNVNDLMTTIGGFRKAINDLTKRMKAFHLL